MNYERLQHFRQYLATLVTQPLLTPGYTSPILNREFITQQELDEEEQVSGNWKPCTTTTFGTGTKDDTTNMATFSLGLGGA
jgi:hypothetical protein